MLAATLVAVLICTIAGPFGTQALALPSRMVFWLVLIGLQSGKWWLWYAWVGPRAVNRRGALLLAAGGTVLLNALLPLEIDLLYRAVGRPMQLQWLGLYLMALIIGGAISALIAVLRGDMPGPQPAAADEARPMTAPSLLAQRAGLPDLTGVLTVMAEDHYLRLVLADGAQGYRRPLLLFRLSDALPELAANDGLQVHRSAWVARRHVQGARRDGRRWMLVLADGTEQVVSETHLPAVRAAGWLQTKL